MHPARLLALKITLAILWVLLVILMIFGVIGYFQSERQTSTNFAGRIEQITNRPKFLERLGRPGERVPPFARNLIFVGPIETITTGFLANMEVDLSFLNTLPLREINKVEFEGNNIQIYGQQFPNGKVFLYESIDPKKELQSWLLIFGGLAIFLFSLVLYGIALRIAKLTLDPLEVARERSRSYNRYLAHELKTPLAVIRSDLELTRAGGVYDLPSLESSLEEINLMQETIDSLLTLSEAERNMSKISIHLAWVVQEVANELQRLPENSSKNIDISISSDIKILAVPNLLRSLTRNILENALKYWDIGTIQILYTQGVLSVSNPLSSWSKVHTKQIFEEFVGTPGAGSGLWLALVARIADLHDWKVHAKQTQKTFTILVEGMK